MSEYIAASANQGAVAAAVGLADDGDTVLIPSGTATWTTGIATTKQIIIRAENYVATPAGTAGAGAMSRNVTIINNSADYLFNLTSGNLFHCGIGGIAFEEGTGDGGHIVLQGSGTKVPLIFDCFFENKSRYSPAQRIIEVACRGGVVWNCVFIGLHPVSDVGEGTLRVELPNGIRNWETASTMGVLDTDGDINFYVEDTSFLNCGAAPDCGNHGRYVCRHFLMNGSWGGMHAFTSTWGGRFVEFYDGLFSCTTDGRNMGGRYFWIRGGTGVFTDNEVQSVFDPSDYGDAIQLQMGEGDIAPASAYLIPRQPGCGHNGSAYVSDPIYVWDQTGARAYTTGINISAGEGFGDTTWADVIIEDRDYFVDNGAKPGYSKYTYPHPLRAGIIPPPEPPPVTTIEATDPLNTYGTGVDLDGQGLWLKAVGTAYTQGAAGVVGLTGSFGPFGYYISEPEFLPDQWAELECDVLTTDQPCGAGPAVRVDPDTDSFYQLTYVHTTTTVYLRVINAGVATNIETLTSLTYAAGTVFRLAVEGQGAETRLTGTANGVVIPGLESFDPGGTYIDSGQPGLGGFGGGNGRALNFSAFSEIPYTPPEPIASAGPGMARQKQSVPAPRQIPAPLALARRRKAMIEEGYAKLAIATEERELVTLLPAIIEAVKG